MGRSTILFLAAPVLLAGCGREGEPATRAPAAKPVSSEQAYHPAPSVLLVETSREGRVALSGSAQPGARVRLAMPDGRAILVIADADGRWRVTLPADPGMRFFSVSMTDAGRTIQSEGYIAIAPDAAALLRAGAGAAPLFPASGGPRVAALDFDRKGGAVITAQAAPGEPVRLLIDGAPRSNGRAGVDGRFVAALNEPLADGDHSLNLLGQRGSATVIATISPAPALPAIPLRAERVQGAWRIDWMTPGGGLQSTLLFTGERS